MVSFYCDTCGDTVKKNQVEKHYQTKCPSCTVLCCLDCGKNFPGDDYKEHTSCVSEAEKYQGKLFKPKDKQNKGERKQQEWLKQVRDSSESRSTDPKINRLMKKIRTYSNIPRKKAKFQNFCKNSVNVRDQEMLDQLWDVFSGQTGKDTEEKEQTNGAVESGSASNANEDNEKHPQKEENNNKKKEKKKKRKRDEIENEIVEEEQPSKNKIVSNTSDDNEKYPQKEENNKKKEKKKKRKRDQTETEIVEEEELPSKNIKITEEKEVDKEPQDLETKSKFNWKSVIKSVLKDAPDNELPVKKLRRKVIAEYNARGGENKSLTDNELRALFDKKINKNPNFKVLKDRAKLVRV